MLSLIMMILMMMMPVIKNMSGDKSIETDDVLNNKFDEMNDDNDERNDENDDSDDRNNDNDDRYDDNDDRNDENDDGLIDCRVGLVSLIGQGFGKNQRASGSLPCMQKRHHHHRLCHHHHWYLSSSQLMSKSSSSLLSPSGSRPDTRWRCRDLLDKTLKYLYDS